MGEKRLFSFSISSEQHSLQSQDSGHVSDIFSAGERSSDIGITPGVMLAASLVLGKYFLHSSHSSTVVLPAHYELSVR